MNPQNYNKLLEAESVIHFSKLNIPQIQIQQNNDQIEKKGEGANQRKLMQPNLNYSVQNMANQVNSKNQNSPSDDLDKDQTIKFYQGKIYRNVQNQKNEKEVENEEYNQFIDFEIEDDSGLIIRADEGQNFKINSPIISPLNQRNSKISFDQSNFENQLFQKQNNQNVQSQRYNQVLNNQNELLIGASKHLMGGTESKNKAFDNQKQMFLSPFSLNQVKPDFQSIQNEINYIQQPNPFKSNFQIQDNLNNQNSSPLKKIVLSQEEFRQNLSQPQIKKLELNIQNQQRVQQNTIRLNEKSQMQYPSKFLGNNVEVPSKFQVRELGQINENQGILLQQNDFQNNINQQISPQVFQNNKVVSQNLQNNKSPSCQPFLSQNPQNFLQIPISQRFSIIDASQYQILNGSIGQIQQHSFANPVGRRLDQVQIRRRRMKNARSMKNLYWHGKNIVESYMSDHFGLIKENQNDLSMDFEDSSFKKGDIQQQNANKKLNLVGILIDQKISIEKIEKEIILSEDGNLYKLEAKLDQNLEYQNNTILSEIQNQNANLSNLNESINHNNYSLSSVNNFVSAGLNGQQLQQQNIIVNSSQIYNPVPSNNKMNILKIKILKELNTAEIQQQQNINQQTSISEKIKDFGVTQNGLIYVTEKGEAHIALSLINMNSLIQSDQQVFINQLFQKNISLRNQNAEEHILIDEQAEDQERAEQREDQSSQNRVQYQLNILNEVNLGEQFDSHRFQNNQQQSQYAPNKNEEHKEIFQSEEKSQYFENFEYPLMSIQLKQIQSTFISKVACGLQHTLLLTSSGFVYAMGRNEWGQLGGEQQVNPDVNNLQSTQQDKDIYGPQMIFSLLNTKITDIQCGSYHSLVVGNPRNSTAAIAVGIQRSGNGPNSLQGYQGRGTSGTDSNGYFQNYQSYQNNINKQKQMVFSWGCNTNHQLGHIQLQQNQVPFISEPTIIEELLQYNTIRKISCHGDKSIILVEEPNSIIIFCRRQQNQKKFQRKQKLNENPQKELNTPKRQRDDSQQNDDVGAGEANVQDSPEQNYLSNQIDERPEVFVGAGASSKLNRQIEHLSIYQIKAEIEDGKQSLIVDYSIIEKFNPDTQFKEIKGILYSTHTNNIYLKLFNQEQRKHNFFLNKHNNQVESLLIYQEKKEKEIIQDHYISNIAYLQYPVDILFVVSQIRPDILQQNLVQEQASKDIGQQQQSGIVQQQQQILQNFQLPYPFHNLNQQQNEINEFSTNSSQSQNKGIQKITGLLLGGQKQQVNDNSQAQPQSIPRTLGSVFSQEWRDLLKFIAVSKGSTKVPQGIEPMTFRPGNLPQKSEAEMAKVNQLVEENRKEYIQKMKLKKEEAQKKLQNLILKEEKLAKIWEKEILSDWDNLKSTARVRELWTEGIPKRIRQIVWYRAIGNKSVVTKDLFNIMAERGRKLSELLSKYQQIENQIIENKGNPNVVEQKIQNLKQSQAGGDQKSSTVRTLEGSKSSQNISISTQQTEQDSEILEELYLKYYKLRKKLLMLIQIDSTNYSVQQREKSISLIDQDIKRTFAELNLFQEGMKYNESIQRILRGFAMYRPDIGYVQGMSYIAAIVLLYIQDEYKSFINFSNLMLKYPIMPFYTFNDEFVTKVLQLFKQLFQINLPDLCDHFEMEEIKPKQYVYKWIMTIFATSLPLRILSHVWDLYFLDGIFILYQTSIAILRLLRPKLLQQDMEGILHILQNVQDHICEDDEDKLVDSIFNLVYPQWVYEEIPKLELNHIQHVNITDDQQAKNSQNSQFNKRQ